MDSISTRAGWTKIVPPGTDDESTENDEADVEKRTEEDIASVSHNFSAPRSRSFNNNRYSLIVSAREPSGREMGPSGREIAR